MTTYPHPLLALVTQWTMDMATYPHLLLARCYTMNNGHDLLSSPTASPLLHNEQWPLPRFLLPTAGPLLHNELCTHPLMLTHCLALVTQWLMNTACCENWTISLTTAYSNLNHNTLSDQLAKTLNNFPFSYFNDLLSCSCWYEEPSENCQKFRH